MGSLFRITDGGVDQLEMAPGQTHEVWLASPDAASLSLHVLGPNSVEEQLSLWPPP